MPTTTPEDRSELERLVNGTFVLRGEESSDDLVHTLSCVALGFLGRSLGTLPAASRATEREHLATYVVDTYLQGTRPNPNNNYLAILLGVAQDRLSRPPIPAPPVPDPIVRILATVAMGYTRETDPRATRSAATVFLIKLYLEGR